MQKLPYIIPECYVDTNVVQTLIRQKGVNHQMSCSQVIKLMSQENPCVTQLVKKLQSASGMRLLNGILSHLMENKYDASTDELRSLF